MILEHWENTIVTDRCKLTFYRYIKMQKIELESPGGLQNYLSLTLIQVSFYMCISVVMVGFMLAQKYGIKGAVLSIFLGNIALIFLAIPLSVYTTESRKTTAMQMHDILGKYGSKIATLGLIISLTGWFSVQMTLLSDTVIKGFALVDISVSKIPINLMLGAFIITIVSRGITALRGFAKIMAPLFLVTIILAIVMYVKMDGGSTASFLSRLPASPLASTGNDMAIIGGIIMIMVCTLCGLFDMPTYYRFSSSKRDSIISIILLFGIGVPMIELTGVLFYAFMPNADSIITIMMNNSVGIVFVAWNVMFIAMSECSINNSNLYVSAVNAEIITSKIPFKRRTIIIGAIGIATSFIDVMEHFASFLQAISIVISSLVAVMIINFALKGKISQRFALISVCCGTIGGILSFIGVLRIVDDAVCLEVLLITTITYAICSQASWLYQILLRKKDDKILCRSE